MANIVETNHVQSSSSSDIISIVSSTTRGHRLAIAKAKQEAAGRDAELAKANVEIAEAELEEAKAASQGSVGRMADVQSDGGATVNAGHTFRGPVVQDSLLDRQDLQGSQGSPAEAESGVQGHVYMIQQHIDNEHYSLESQTVIEQSGAVEAVMQFAERRHI